MLGGAVSIGSPFIGGFGIGGGVSVPHRYRGMPAFISRCEKLLLEHVLAAFRLLEQRRVSRG